MFLLNKFYVRTLFVNLLYSSFKFFEIWTYFHSELIFLFISRLNLWIECMNMSKYILAGNV